MGSPKLSVIKRLFAVSGNKCAFPSCLLPIAETSGTVTGEVAHIKALNAKGPRYDKKQTEEERNAFQNLILLCSRHHTIIDSEVDEYTVESLTKIKKEHELKGVIEISPFTAVVSKNLLENHQSIFIKNDGGNVAVNSPGATQAGIINNFNNTKPKINWLSPPGTIGGKPILKRSIIDRFNKVGEEREKRFGKSAYSVMYKNFKKDFEIKKGAWTQIWDWPETSSDIIINYLDEKFLNTIAGRNKTAIKKGTMIPSKGHLYAREKELLSQVNLEVSSPEVKDALHKYFGVTSHTKLDKQKHWQWVLYLESKIEKYIGEL